MNEEWIRIKAGEYISSDKRFHIIRKNIKEWNISDTRKHNTYSENSLRMCKIRVSMILNGRKKLKNP
ncbi:MAG: hypothetical protein IJT36_03205 [Alphaproteobacteria bacterium]|nr:hypothetical protein [Alphaproteobacteria bacterium]